ncbi:MAG: ubiquinone/menaquinone biosynthesis C-methylase UbiE [Flavobacteriales bacterium]|jgi:ubiquinone/menaquinone biosynthesis C-methylase UbiE
MDGNVMINHDSKFWDRLANFYSKRPVSNHDAYQHKLDVSCEYLDSESELFEFGCGTGSTAIYLAPHVKHIHAIDFSANMLKIARTKAEAEGLNNINFEQAAINDIQIKNSSLDAVLAHSILHLLINRDEAIKKIFALLKPGGIFISSTTCMGTRFNPLRFVLGIGSAFGLLPHVMFFSVEELQVALTEAGFSIDYSWQAEGSNAVFFVAKKPE